MIDIASPRRPVSTIQVGPEPFAVAITPDQSPLASFTAGRARPGVPVSLNASASKDPDGTIASFAFAFGDGRSATQATATAAHTYSSPGSYTATLSVTDNEDCSAALIFSGQTASCSGSVLANAVATVKVAYPGVRLSCPKRAKPGGCRFALEAIAAKPHRGKRAKAESAIARAKVRAGHSKIVSLKPKAAFKKKLATATSVLVTRTLKIAGSKRTRTTRLKIVQ